MEVIPLLLDEPISDINNDEFGHRHYAELLYSLIVDNKYRLPYNIGLLGKWGVGKSSIKSMCQEKLLKEHKDDILCVDFNAWKYGGDGIKKALLRHVYISVNGTDEQIKDEFSRNITKQVLELSSNNELFKHWRNVLFNWGQIVILLALLFWGYIYIAPFFGEVGKTITSVSFAGLAAVIIRGILTKNNILIPLFQNITKMDLPSATAEVYEEFLKKQIGSYKTEHNKINKIVVFVDDLDRLPTAEEMIEGINAIRAFMDIKLPAEIGVIFVLSCCEYKIAEALASIDIDNKHNNIIDKESFSIDKKIEAKRFLDKIFQFRIDLPPFPYQDMINYSKTLIKNQITNFTEFETELEKCGTNIENLLCRLIHPKVQDPRRAIQIINSFFQSWNIAKQRELQNNNNKAGGLANGIVTKHPLTLAILSVIKVDFPYFYKKLLEEPKLLNFVLETIRTNKLPSMHIDEKIKNEFIGKDNKLKAEYYELDLYLSTMNNKFELPKSLKPFLLLNQDPLSRKHGEDAFEIEETLIYKKPQRLVNLLKLKETALSKEDATLILNTYESIPYDAHKQSAFSTILQLTEYVTDETNFLLNPLAEILQYDANYRAILTISDFGNLLKKANKSKSKKILRAMDKTFMQQSKFYVDDEDANSQIDYEKQSFIEVTKIKLNYYNANRNQKDIEFFKWLTNPVIGELFDDAVEPQKQDDIKIDFNYIDNLIQENSFVLDYITLEYLNAFYNEYINKTIEEIENEVELEFLFENVKAALVILVEKGKEEDFSEWLDNFISSSNKLFFQFAYNYTNEILTRIPQRCVIFYIEVLLYVVIGEIKKPNLFASHEMTALVEFLKPKLKDYYNDFDSNAKNKVNEFVELICCKDEYIEFAIDLYKFIIENKGQNTTNIEQAFIDESFLAPISNYNRVLLREFLFKNYLKLKIEQKNTLVNALQPLIIKSNVSCLEDNDANMLVDFLALFPNDKMKQEANTPENSLGLLFDGILNHLCNYVIPNGYTNYFEQLFNIKDSFKNLNSPNLAKMLHMACTHTSFYSVALSKMSGIWKDLYKSIWKDSNYLQKIFTYTVTSYTNITLLKHGSEIYSSLKQLQTQENLGLLYSGIYQQRAKIVEASQILTELKNIKVYSVVEIASWGTAINLEDNNDEARALENIWLHLIDSYNSEERENIIEQILLSREYTRLRIWVNVIKQKTGKYKEIHNVLQHYSKDEKINTIINDRNAITQMFIGNDRKEPSQIILLNAEKILHNQQIANRVELCREMLRWSYDLYNDIIRETTLRNLSDEFKRLVLEIFGKDKTFGKIRIKEIELSNN